MCARRVWASWWCVRSTVAGCRLAQAAPGAVGRGGGENDTPGAAGEGASGGLVPGRSGFVFITDAAGRSGHFVLWRRRDRRDGAPPSSQPPGAPRWPVRPRRRGGAALAMLVRSRGHARGSTRPPGSLGPARAPRTRRRPPAVHMPRLCLGIRFPGIWIEPATPAARASAPAAAARSSGSLRPGRIRSPPRQPPAAGALGSGLRSRPAFRRRARRCMHIGHPSRRGRTTRLAPRPAFTSPADARATSRTEFVVLGCEQ